MPYMINAVVTVVQTDQTYNPNGQQVTITGSIPIAVATSSAVTTLLQAAQTSQVTSIMNAIAAMTGVNPSA